MRPIGGSYCLSFVRNQAANRHDHVLHASLIPLPKRDSFLSKRRDIKISESNQNMSKAAV
jgi:hypothetical protein